MPCEKCHCDAFALPPLVVREHVLDVAATGDYLIPELGLGGLRGRLKARRESMPDRVAYAADLMLTSDEPWIAWCGLNPEQDGLARRLGDAAVSVAGADSEDEKEAKLLAFLRGDARVLLTKIRVAGFGLNLQHCARMVFVGLSDSFEGWFQAVRRCWRFGQRRPVEAHIVISAAERVILANVQRKEAAHRAMAAGLVAAMQASERAEIGVTARERDDYRPETPMVIPAWM